MQTFRYDYNSSLEENIKVITNGTEEILFSFEVVPLDTYVDDISSPTIIFTQNLVIFRYDHIIEASLLSETDIYMMGDEPQFRVFWQLFEPTYFTIEIVQKQFTILRITRHKHESTCMRKDKSQKASL